MRSQRYIVRAVTALWPIGVRRGSGAAFGLPRRSLVGSRSEMPSAFSQCLKSLASEVILGAAATPDAERKKRGGGKQDPKATPAKKRRETTADRTANNVSAKIAGGASGSSALCPEGLSKAERLRQLESEAAVPLHSSTSRAELATREEQPETAAPEVKAKAKAKAARRKKSEADVEASGELKEAPEVKKVRKAKPEGPYTKYKEEGSIPEPSIARRELPAGKKSFKAVAWNVGGLRSFARNRPDALPELITREQPDVIGLMEHKFQEGAADTESTMKTLMESMPDYESVAVHCSTTSTKPKGYSGTLILLRKDGPKALSVEPCDLPSAKNEGRLIVVEFEQLFVVLAYVPNSGDVLQRLDERTGQWDLQLREKLQGLSAKKPTVLMGDLNVAHRDEDIWNAEAPHVPKSAGTTARERESFSQLLGAGFVDGFAHMHPEALGAFTYWSIRAGNRPKNRGLRLDYAVASRSLLSSSAATDAEKPSAAEGSGMALVDVFHLVDMSPGDHCPVGALLSM